MENATQHASKAETTALAKCKTCQKVVYVEQHVERFDQATGAVTSRSRVVSGHFTQETDAEGIPNGPVIPLCPTCKKDG